MTDKLNCWQIKRCRRGIGGSRSGELGICPAATEASADGLNGGVNGGRICWAIAGTFCDGEVQGTHSQKHGTCMTCEVYHRVQKETGKSFKVLIPGRRIP